jgi:hypothetical protein
MREQFYLSARSNVYPMPRFKTLLIIACLLICGKASAYQPVSDRPEFFIEHLHNKNYPIDSTANAIVLFESAHISLRSSPGKGWFVTKRIRKVIKVLTRDGIRYSDVIVPFINTENAGVKVVSAETYNLEGGQFKRQEMDAKNVATTGGEGALFAKFSLPGVREGSVIDYTYTVSEGFSYTFGEWEFEEEIPKLHSEVALEFHESFQVAINTQTKQKFTPFAGDEMATATADMPEYYTTVVKPMGGAAYKTGRWVRRNVKAAIEEPYNYNIKNYTEKIMFQASGAFESTVTATHYSWRGYDIDSWDKVNKMMYDRIFNFNPGDDNITIVNTLVNKLTANIKDSLQVAQVLYRYVRDSFAITGGNFFSIGSINNVMKTRAGDFADLNLLLLSLLKSAGLEANAVILSTRSSLRINKAFPLMDRINYLICQVKVNGNTYHLDASQRYNSFGVLSPFCYNGFAWVIAKKGYSIDLQPASLMEKQAVVVRTVKNDIDDYVLNVKAYFGNVGAARLRKEWSEDTSEIKKSILSQIKPFENVTLKSYTVKGLKDADTTLVLDYDIKMDWENADIFQLTPSLFNYYLDNPFKSSVRSYPIEMDYAVDSKFSLNLQLPSNMTIAELPQSATYKFDEQNYYKYGASSNEPLNQLTLNTRLQMHSTFFDIADYNGLKQFFDDVIVQQHKICVIKKNK